MSAPTDMEANAKAIALADLHTEAAAAAKFLEDVEANAGAKALEEAKAALAMVHLDTVILHAAFEVSQKVRKEMSERILPCEAKRPRKKS